MQIVVYVDEGVSGPSLRKLWKSLQENIDPSYTIVRKDAKSILQENWEEDTAMFVMPGGRDVPYTNSLKKEGTNKIRRYVESGGKYLGICAGAYFASDSILFEKGGELEVIGERFLKFYPGVAEGPALGLNQYRPDSEAGACFTQVIVDGKSVLSYFNGGCFFVSPHHLENVEVCGYYDSHCKEAAVVECKAGKGKAVLTGIHLEYPVEEKFNSSRQEAFRSLFERLDISLLPCSFKK